MGRQKHGSWLARDREAWHAIESARFCEVVVAGVAAAGATAYSANKSSKAASKATDAAGVQAEAANAIAQRQQDMAEDQYQRYLSIYAPLEAQFVEEARNLDSFANQNKSSQQAAADVAASFAAARERLNDNPGVDPGSQAYLQEANRTNLAEAATSAAAQTGAREMVRDKGRAATIDAMSLGKGLPASASSGFGSAASGMRSAAEFQQRMASDAGRKSSEGWGAAGRIVGGITQSDSFKNWLNPSSNTAAGGYTAPGGGGFGSDLGFDDPYGR